MAGTLSRAGFDLILWNRNPEKIASLADQLGAMAVSSAAEAASKVDVVLTSLADDAAVDEVYSGADGIAAGIGLDCVAIDTSTIDPDTAIRAGNAVEAAHAAFLDAPVSGSVSTVEQGALAIMVGGDEAVLARVATVMEALATRVIHVGPRGSGAAAKLAVNALVHGLNVALSEALVLAERAGIDRATAYDIFASGAAGAPFVQYKRAAYEKPETTPVAFSLDLVAKDLELITGLGARVGAPLRQAEVGLAIVQEAIAAGLGDADLSAIAVHLRGVTNPPSEGARDG